MLLPLPYIWRRYACLLLIATTGRMPAAELNSLSAEEIAAGWHLLWDGHSAAGWRSARSPEFPARGWEMKDGTLTVLRSDGSEGGEGGDIITIEKYGAFELSLEFQLTPGANSGIKYLVDPAMNQGKGSAIGFEYQLLDDERHPDAKLGRDDNRTLASLYDLLPAASDKAPNPIGSWNTARIICRGQTVEHWLNGHLVLKYKRFTPEFRALVSGSKYKKWPGFGEWQEGHILLQDHGFEAHFRNIKIRRLP